MPSSQVDGKVKFLLHARDASILERAFCVLLNVRLKKDYASHCLRVEKHVAKKKLRDPGCSSRILALDFFSIPDPRSRVRIQGSKKWYPIPDPQQGICLIFAAEGANGG